MHARQSHMIPKCTPRRGVIDNEIPFTLIPRIHDSAYRHKKKRRRRTGGFIRAGNNGRRTISEQAPSFSARPGCLIPSLLHLFYDRGISRRRRRRENSSGTRNRESAASRASPRGAGKVGRSARKERAIRKERRRRMMRRKTGGTGRQKKTSVRRSRRERTISSRHLIGMVSISPAPSPSLNADGEIAHLEATRENE